METENKVVLGCNEREALRSDPLVRSTGPCPYSIDGLLGLASGKDKLNGEKEHDYNFKTTVISEAVMENTDLKGKSYILFWLVLLTS